MDFYDNTSLSIPMWNNSSALGINHVEGLIVTVFGVPILLATVLGNLLVIAAIFRYQPLYNPQNMLLVSLAVADVLVAALVMPFNIAYTLLGRWIFGLFLCKAWLTCDILMCTSSILHLCVIAMDRFSAIHDPIGYAYKRTFSRCIFNSIAVWVVSLLISVPPLIGWNDWPDDFTGLDGCSLTDEKSYVLFSSMGSFFVPLFIMSIVYLRIFVATRRRLRSRARAALIAARNKENEKTTEDDIGEPCHAIPLVVATQENSSDVPLPTTHLDVRKCYVHSPQSEYTVVDTELHSQVSSSHGLATVDETAKAPCIGNNGIVKKYIEDRQKISLSRERRAARVLSIVVGVFILCWLPFFLMYVIMPFCEQCELSSQVMLFITWLGYLNSSLNPVIYTVFNQDFRRAFQRLLGCNNHRHR